MATQIEIQEIVLDKFDLGFEPRVPKFIDKKANPKFINYVETFLEVLGDFSANDLKAGVRLWQRSKQYQKWPHPGDMWQFCLKAQQEKKEVEERYRPRVEREALPEPEPISKEDRLIMADRMKRLVVALTGGRDMYSDETRRYVYGE